MFRLRASPVASGATLQFVNEIWRNVPDKQLGHPGLIASAIVLANIVTLRPSPRTPLRR